MGSRIFSGKVRREDSPAAERRTGERPGSPAPLQRGLGNRIVAHEIAARGAADPGAALPHLDRLEAAFGGHSLRGVRAHFGAAARQSAADLGARAYAFGEDVVFRESTPSLGTVAHEAAHVIQQRVGEAAPRGRVGDGHERHADAVAARVVAGDSAGPLLAGLTSAGPPRPALQLVDDDERELARQAEVARIKARLVAALHQGPQQLAAEFRRVSSRWLVRRSRLIRTIDQQLGENRLADALITAQRWYDSKGTTSARGAAVRGLIEVLDELQQQQQQQQPQQQPPQEHAPDEDAEEDAGPEVAALWETLEAFAYPIRTNRAAVVDPEGFLRETRDWDEVRSHYKKDALWYESDLGPAKDGTFDLAAAQQRQAGMNILLACRLRETLLKRADEPRMHWAPAKTSVLQGVRDELGLAFDWNYGAGTESPTSDIDSNLSGVGTEQAVLRFNHVFRTAWGRESGTVFDVNVYARDFLPVLGSAPALNKAFQQAQGPAHGAPANALGFAAFQQKGVELDQPVQFEVPLDRGSGAYGGAMRSERVYALVKTCMDMPDADWQSFKQAHLAVAAQADAQAHDGGGRQATLTALLHQVDAVVAAREQAIQGRIALLKAAPGAADHDERDLDMRAQNELYAEGLAEVADLRGKLAGAAGPERDGLAASLTDALHRSLIYANESYVTGAAVQHVVLDKQMLSARQKDPLRLRPPAGAKPKNLKLHLTTERYQNSLHEQLGFAFREFELYHADPQVALGKASKYIYRLGNAAKHINRDTGKDIARLAAVRAFGKGLLALKVTPDEAAQHGVTFASVVGDFGLNPADPTLLAEVKRRLIAFSADVLAALA